MFRRILRRASLAPVCRRDTLERRLAKACRAMAAPLVAILALVQPIAEAAPVVSGIKYTGMGYADGQGGPDSNWKVEVLPVDSTVTTSTPFAARVFSGTGVPGDAASWKNVPDPWYGGHTNAGLPGYGRWIGVQQDDATALLPDSMGGPSPKLMYYSTIFSTTFESSEDGTTFLWFRATADNRVTFFVNGTVTGASGNQATITGGSQVAAQIQGLSSLKTVSGNVAVKSGTNTLYAVVADRYTIDTSTFGYTGLIVVPEPSTMSSVGMAGAGLAVAAAGRHLRRRKKA